MDEKAKIEARKAAQQRYNAKMKAHMTYCEDCNKQVSTPSWRKHIVSKKHLQNTYKERKPFFEEMIDLWNQCGVEGANIRKLCIEMHDLIEGEYFDENRQEIIPEEERYDDPMPYARSAEEKEFCENTVFGMEERIDSLLQKLNNTKPYHVHIDYLEDKEVRFNQIRKDVDSKDLKKKLLFCFQDLLQPWPKDKSAEEEQKKLEKWHAAQREQEEIIKQKAEMLRPSQRVLVDKSDEDGEDEDFDYSDAFPAYATFLRVKKGTKNKILQQIAESYIHIFDRPMHDLYDIIEQKRTQDYNEAYSFALQCKTSYDEQNGDEMDMSEVEEEEEEEM